MPTQSQSGWAPEQAATFWLPSQAGTSSSLFTVSSHMEVRLRIRSEQRGSVRITLDMDEPLIKNEHLLAGPFSVGPGWRDIVIPSGQFVPFRQSRKPAAGPAIRCVGIFGFGSGEFLVDEITVVDRTKGRGGSNASL